MVTISVVIATIPPREAHLRRVLKGFANQTRQANEIVVVPDDTGAGVAPTRNIGISTAKSDFIAFFDDDDLVYPSHLQLLEETQLETGADLVYPWHDLVPEMRNPLSVVGNDPFKRPFDGLARSSILSGVNFIPCPVLVRTAMMRDIGGFRDFKLGDWDPSKCELLHAWQDLIRMEAVFAHCPWRTWAAVRNGQNTAGLSWPDHIGTTQIGYDT